MKELLPRKTFPGPDKLPEYLKWDDWYVLGLLANGQSGEHGERLRFRNHYPEVYHTPEVPERSDLERLECIREQLGNIIVAERMSSQSWYRLEQSDIPIQTDDPDKRIVPLSRLSSVVAAMNPIEQIRLYVDPKDAEEARERIKTIQ